MTQYARAVFDAFRRRPALPGGSPVTLTVRVPPDLPGAAAEELVRTIVELVGERARGLGLRHSFDGTLETRPAGIQPAADRITVALADRPVAVLPGPIGRARDGDLVGPAAAAVERALRRRLSLLAGGAPGPAGGPAPDRRLAALGYVLDSAVSVQGAGELPADQPAGTAELGEQLVERLAPREVVVEAAAATVAATADRRPDDMTRARAALYASTGLQFPDVRVVPTDEPPGTVRLRLNDVTLPARRLRPDARWSDVASVVRDELQAHAAWFVRMSAVQEALGRLADVAPDLVELTTGCYSPPLLAGCVREVLRQGDSARNLPRILWLLLEAGDEPSPGTVSLSEAPLLATPDATRSVAAEPSVLVATLRRQVAYDAPRTAAAPDRGATLWLPADLEKALTGPVDPTGLAAAEWGVVEAVLAAGDPRQVAVGTGAAIAPVRSALQALPVPPRVISAQEMGVAAIRGDAAPARSPI